MGRIIGYQYDDNVQDGDAWIGSEDGGGRTKQYTAEAVANYLNIQGKISIVGQMTYEYVVGPQGGIGTFSLFGGGTSPVAFSSVTKLTYSNTDKGGQRVVEFLNLLVGSDVLIAKQNEISTFGYYTVDSYTVNASDSSYYDLAVTFKAGNGAMTFLEIYDVQNFVLANDATQSPWEIVADGINYPDGNVGIGITNSEDYFNIEKTDTLNSITRGSQVTLTKNNTTGTDFAARLYGFRSLVSNTSSGNVGYVQGGTDNVSHSGTGDMYIMVGGVATSNHEGSGNASGVYGGFHSGQASGTGTTSINFLVGDVINATLNNPNATVQKYHGINNQLAFSAGTVTEEAAVALLDIDSNAAAIINGDFSYLYIKQNSVYPTISGDARSIYSNSILPSTFTGSVSIGKSALPTSALEVLGNVKFDSYGSGTITGTPTQRLGVDASGNVIEIPIGSGAVDGAGTTNFVTKWLDTDTVGDSVIFDNGTNVGIGTTNPLSPLHVASIASGPIARFINTSGTGGNGVTIQGGNGSGIILSLSDYSNIERLRVNGNGNVGIGTTSPGAKLDVNGNVAINYTGGASASNQISMVGSRASFGYDGSISSAFMRSSDTSKPLVFGSGASELMRIVSSTGNVGIGTTSPAYKLHIVGGFYQNGTSFTNYFDGDTKFGGSNSYSTIVKANGNVGIGTTSPVAKLDIYDATNSNFYLRTGGTGANWIASAGNSQIGTYTNTPFVLKSNDIARIQIQAGGNVGIGVTSPSEKLEVNGRVVANAFRTDVNTGDYSVISRSSAGNAPLYVQSADSDTNQPIAKFFYGDAAPNQGSVVLNVAKDQTFFSNTNVGIGTTSPGAKLEVVSARGAEGIHLNDGSFPTIGKVKLDVDANGDGEITLVNSNSQITSVISGGESSYLMGGNVGIGTTSPGQKLEVANGRIAVDSNYGFQLANTGSTQIGRWFNSSGINYLQGDSQRSWQIGSITNGVNTYFDSINNRVGIGTTSPSNVLTIGTDSTAKGIDFYAGSTRLGSIERMTIGSAVSIGLEGANGRPVSINNNHSSQVIIANGGGNVGIGTTSPTSKLEVAGGDIELSDVAGGITMISPDGTRYRITVANGGTLTVTAV